ncbi:hypothetical protein ACIRU3_00640 [Streptomyces sp. NPDC101151]|uniref:hypothetical protein n=1 Tax=Streptomyces sp. NPDC101151 TaxID=3366115 RepID=UPI0038216D26
MTPIRAQSRAAETVRQAEPAPEPVPPAVRRGRHRKPRPRKVLLAAGGLALAAGVLSLVRVTPESGVGAPGTAEAEPRLDPGAGVTDGAADTAATTEAGPTAPPSATSVMGGVSAAPTTADKTAPTPAATTLPGSTGVPTTIPTGAPPPTSTPSTHSPRPAPTTPTPTRPPAPSPTAPAQGDVCVPVIGLCVDLPGGVRPGRRGA